MRPLIAGNWKMHKTPDESEQLARQVVVGVRDVKDDRIVVLCPPFTSLARVSAVVGIGPVKLGGQNMASEKSGAFTGEVSALFLKELGCQYVIVGHSERRALFHEDDALVNRKLKLALELKLVPIFCVGETLAERESNRTFDVLARQLSAGLREVAWRIDSLVIAYEPVWAIGTGRTATPAQASEVHAFIRDRVKAGGPPDAADVTILYGGSVKADNIDELMARPEINGVLVGGASLKAEEFLRIITYKV
jgi:triosephosphate isomerase